MTLEQCGPAPESGTIYLEGQVTKRPILIRPGGPRYPERLRAAGIFGRVKLAFVIDTAGKAVESSVQVLFANDPGFVGPSRSILLGARFVPGVLDGHPVAVCTAQTINFTP